jgi:serpin B
MKLRILLSTALSATSLLFSEGVSEDINCFGFAISKPLTENDANAIYSPFSLFTCFSMVASGAEGATKNAMETGLHWSQSRQNTASNLAALSEKLFAPTEEACKLKLRSANAIFAEQDTTFLPNFKSLIENEYRAEAQALDFSKSDQATQLINTWVSNETNQKIRDLLQQGDIDASTRMVLVNALYFQGTWQSQFNKKATTKRPFSIDENTSLAVSMMRQVNQFRYFDDANVQVAILPLCSAEHARPSLIVVLPKTPGNFSRISERISTQDLQNYLATSTSQRLDLQLPAFCLRKRYDLQKALTSLGMGIAFTDQADFSAIDGMKDLYLSKALHEGYFDLNENGIEAAAATAAAINVTSVGPSKEKPILFIADHPFLFFLIDEESGVVLFAGKFSDPNLSQCR